LSGETLIETFSSFRVPSIANHASPTNNSLAREVPAQANTNNAAQRVRYNFLVIFISLLPLEFISISEYQYTKTLITYAKITPANTDILPLNNISKLALYA
jgi:hypothetical protein